MLEEIWLVPLGLAAGILGSMIGLGGGLITVPAMTFAGYAPTLAVANSLCAAFSNAVASTISYSRRGNIEYRTGAKLALLAVPGTVLGALATVDVPAGLFQMLFGIVLTSSAIYMFAKSRVTSQRMMISWYLILLTVGASFFAGTVSSFFGIGGGIIFVPLMVAILGIGMRRAAPTSQFILLFASFSGMIIHGFLGHPDLYQAALLSAGAFAGGIIGARISTRVNERYLAILAAAAIMAAAVKLFLDSQYWRFW